MRGQRRHLGADPRVQRQPADRLVQLGGVVRLPDADVAQAAGQPPDALDRPGAPQLAPARRLGGQQLGAALGRHLGAERDVDPHEELHQASSTPRTAAAIRPSVGSQAASRPPAYGTGVSAVRGCRITLSDRSVRNPHLDEQSQRLTMPDLMTQVSVEAKGTHWRWIVSGIVACAGLMLVPVGAAAEVRTGTLTDPSGDADAAARDIPAAEFSYDTAGAMVAKVTLAAAPTAATPADVFVRTGPAGSSQCLQGAHLGLEVDLPSGDRSADLSPGGPPLPPPTVTQQ